MCVKPERVGEGQRIFYYSLDLEFLGYLYYSLSRGYCIVLEMPRDLY